MSVSGGATHQLLELTLSSMNAGATAPLSTTCAGMLLSTMVRSASTRLPKATISLNSLVPARAGAEGSDRGTAENEVLRWATERLVL